MISVEALKERAQKFWENYKLSEYILVFKVAGYKGIWELKVVNVFRKNYNLAPTKYLYYVNKNYPDLFCQHLYSTRFNPLNIALVHNPEFYDVQVSDEDPIDFLIEEEIEKLKSTLYHPLFMQRLDEDIMPLVESCKIEGKLDENFAFIYYPIVVQGEILLRDTSITLIHKETKDSIVSLYVYDSDIVEKLIKRGKHLGLNKRKVKEIIEKAKQIVEQYGKSSKETEKKFKDMQEKLNEIKRKTEGEITPFVEQYRAILYEKKVQLDI